MNCYGKELIIDLHNCDESTFGRRSIKNYIKRLCKLIEMEPVVLYWWDNITHPDNLNNEYDLPHLSGRSAVQFIKTSNITIHVLDKLNKVFINIFSCKNFSDNSAAEFSKEWFKGEIISQKVIRRY